jgi:drug/metabolite transporter (DMT)-like permease
LFSTLTTIIYLPLVLGFVFWQRPRLDAIDLLFIFGSFVLHLAYFLMLQQGYRVGDLSVVYPLARGTGPALSTVAAILLLGERPSAVALGGAFLVICGVVMLSGGVEMARKGMDSQAVTFGLVTGAFIASYTLWDKYAVSVVLVAPLLLDYGTAIGRTVFLAPFAGRRWDEVRHYWTHHRPEVIGVAILVPLSYILVLTAMTVAPVSYVAPAREVSTLIGVLMGVFWLNEGNVRQRLSAASVIVLGVMALALT